MAIVLGQGNGSGNAPRWARTARPAPHWHFSPAMLALVAYNDTMLDARQIAEIVRRQDHDPGVS
ncbi:MAG TPA: hypothetical protein VGO86_07400, partial [Candidatus Dormibacteraeota bacterium]